MIHIIKDLYVDPEDLSYAYQGKYDASATSGTAKQYSINQAAGRLESKRTMKNNAYSALFKMIFQLSSL